MTPHRYLVVHVTVISARINTNVPHIGARLSTPGSLALGAQHSKLDADLRISALLGTPSVHSVHDYYPFAEEDGGRLVPIVGEVVDRLDMLVAIRRFLGMGVTDYCSLRCDNDVRMQHFVRRSIPLPFRLFGGIRGENSCNVFLLPFIVLWVPICATLCRRAMLMVWLAFLFLGLGFLSFSLLPWWSPLPFLLKNTFSFDVITNY
jgi:hypothetical protein